MDLDTFILLAVLETLAMVVLVRMWKRHRRRHMLFRVCWAVLLLVPLVGVLLYAFIMNDPEKNPHKMETAADRDVEAGL